MPSGARYLSAEKSGGCEALGAFEAHGPTGYFQTDEGYREGVGSNVRFLSRSEQGGAAHAGPADGAQGHGEIHDGELCRESPKARWLARRLRDMSSGGG